MKVEIGYGEIEAVLEKIMGEGIRFETLVTEMTEGKGVLSPGRWLAVLGEYLIGQLRLHADHVGYLLLLIFSAAMLSVIAKAFRSRQISDMAFYVIYLLMFLIMMRSFGVCYELTEKVILDLIDFMRVLMPAYLMAAAVGAYRVSAFAYYECFLLLVYWMEKLVLYLLLPAIRGYVLLTLFSYLGEDDFFSRGRESLKRLILFLMKAMLGAAVGLQMIQAMISPAIDEFRHTALSRGISSLGAVGNAAQNVTDVLLGSGMLLKNGIGAAAAVILILICLLPVAQTGCYAVFYQFLAAVSEPVADKRVTGAVAQMGESIGLLVRLLFSVCALFLLTIAVVCMTTGGIV